MEVELKYALPADLVDVILSAPFLQTVPIPRQMHSRYYDTSQRTLQAHGIVLRMRKEDSAWVCCLKGPSSGVNGLFRREEFAFSSLENGIAVLQQRGLLTASDALHVTAEVRFVRRQTQLQIGSSILELAIDTGAFLAADGTEFPFSELELEQKQGPEQELLAFGSELQSRYGLVPQTESKFMRAQRIR